VRTDQWIR